MNYIYIKLLTNQVSKSLKLVFGVTKAAFDNFLEQGVSFDQRKLKFKMNTINKKIYHTLHYIDGSTGHSYLTYISRHVVTWITDRLLTDTSHEHVPACSLLSVSPACMHGDYYDGTCV